MRRSDWPGIARRAARTLVRVGVRLAGGVGVGAGLLGATGAPVAAWAGNPMPFVRANQWAHAAAAVAASPDPVARKLVTFYRLLAPGAATPDQIAAFMAANQTWPDRRLLARRLQQALVADDDDANVAALCTQRSITLPAALVRCADALGATGQPMAAAHAARLAWAAGLVDHALVATFLHRWSAALTPEDEWARFHTLLRAHPEAAGAQIPRLPPSRRPVARAWLALRRNASDGLGLARALPAADRALPGLVLAEAQWLRHAGRDSDALALWRRRGFAAERATTPGRRVAFWRERDILARDLLRTGDAADAFAAADDRMQSAPAAVAASGFLAGFIALTALHQPVQAATSFHRLTAVSKAAITDARAHYWLGRAAAAAGADPTGEYRLAAAYPTTFYGQIAARTLGEPPAARIDAARDPRFTREQALAFTRSELVRAALLLAAWSEPGRARAFVMQVAERAPAGPGQAAEQTLAARLALALDLPETAVFIARRMGLEGWLLPQSGWPMPVRPPAGAAVNPAIVLALIRQESSFDRGAVSPAGARGLMQLLPGTAEQLARQRDDPITEVALTRDAQRNMQLGTAYLAKLLARFGGSLPLAVAAYNAGPHRVDQWLAENGMPKPGALGMIDWIERIPFGETRNYVQRVLENVVIYLARRGTADPVLTAQWLPSPIKPAQPTGAARQTEASAAR
ncbi:MAG: lytic transglycosylase domain-containing protein [Rhodospirillales bacterium]|nr:lytic transglycosylase domain-containing protein [Rhodospirillales bacterium]